MYRIHVLLIITYISNVFTAKIQNCNDTDFIFCTGYDFYDKWKPPTSKTNDLTMVDMEFDLNHISNVNEDKHTITLFLKLTLSWDDPRIIWQKQLWEWMYTKLNLYPVRTLQIFRFTQNLCLK